MRVEKHFSLSNFGLSVLLDIYNVFNNGSVTDVIDRVDLATYKDAVTLQNPRYFQLGLRFSF